jgi:hypothetical protein
MPDTVRIKVEGLATVEKAPRTLPRAVQTRVLGHALEAGGDVIRDGIRDRIHERTGRTSADVQTVVQVNPDDVAGVAAVGATKGKTGRAHILNFLERGTKPHVEPKKRKGQRITLTLGSRSVTRRAPAERSKPLAFGGKVFSRVKHPGTRAQAPMRITIAERGLAVVRVFGQRAWAGIRGEVERLRRSGGG